MPHGKRVDSLVGLYIPEVMFDVVSMRINAHTLSVVKGVIRILEKEGQSI